MRFSLAEVHNVATVSADLPRMIAEAAPHRNARHTDDRTLARYAQHIPRENAAVSDQLYEVGAVLMGKLALHELAHGGPLQCAAGGLGRAGECPPQSGEADRETWSLHDVTLASPQRVFIIRALVSGLHPLTLQL
jgi:hypothetical protein